MILVDDPKCHEEYPTEMFTFYRIHVYGQITPMELAIESCTRSWDNTSWQKREWHEFLERYDGKEPEETTAIRIPS
jgi:hypothetical protein